MPPSQPIQLGSNLAQSLVILGPQRVRALFVAEVVDSQGGGLGRSQGGALGLGMLNLAHERILDVEPLEAQTYPHDISQEIREATDPPGTGTRKDPRQIERDRRCLGHKTPSGLRANKILKFRWLWQARRQGLVRRPGRAVGRDH